MTCIIDIESYTFDTFIIYFWEAAKVLDAGGIV